MTDATTSRSDRPRILLYVQHLLGILHYCVCRALFDLRQLFERFGVKASKR